MFLFTHFRHFWRIHLYKSCAEKTVWVGVLCTAVVASNNFNSTKKFLLSSGNKSMRKIIWQKITNRTSQQLFDQIYFPPTPLTRKVIQNSLIFSVCKFWKHWIFGIQVSDYLRNFDYVNRETSRSRTFEKIAVAGGHRELINLQENQVFPRNQLCRDINLQLT